MLAFSFAILVLPVFAAAIPWGDPPTVTVTKTASPSPTTTSQCNTGSMQCCNSVQQADSLPVISALTELLGPLAAALEVLNLGANIPVGLTCSPLNVVGVSNTGCSAQPVCCSGNNFKGAVVIGCTPINIGL